MFSLSTMFQQSTLRLKTHVTNLLLRNSPSSWMYNQKYYSTQPSTFYSVLGLTPDATEDEIKQAYYTMSKLYHPDKNMGNVSANFKILEVNEAFEVLGNAAEKEKYDKKMFPALNIGKTSKKHFIYEHTEYYDPPLSQKPIFRKNNNINCTWQQYQSHVKGAGKKKQKHIAMKYTFCKNSGAKTAAKIFAKK